MNSDLIDDLSEDDSFWNTSDIATKASKFVEDELSAEEMLAIGKSDGGPGGEAAEGILSGRTIKPALLPLDKLLSPHALQIILQAQSGEEPPGRAARLTDDTVCATVRRMLTGRACSLRAYRTLREKTMLLDAALAIGDGDTIITVVLFVVSTLQNRLAHNLLSARPLALVHYISHLRAENDVATLADLLTMLGKCSEATMSKFEHIVKMCSDPHTLYSRLQHLQTDNVSPLQAEIITSYIKLLEWQLCAKVETLMKESVLRCLGYCCVHHWSDTAGKIMSPLTLCQQQQISSQQYCWAGVCAHASRGRWDELAHLVTRRSWLGRTSVSAAAPLPRIVRRLRATHAPPPVVAAFIHKIQGAELRLQVAQQYKVHSVVVEMLVSSRDRSALTAYKMSLEPHSEPYVMAETALRDPSIKWKN